LYALLSHDAGVAGQRSPPNTSFADPDPPFSPPYNNNICIAGIFCSFALKPSSDQDQLFLVEGFLPPIVHSLEQQAYLTNGALRPSRQFLKVARAHSFTINITHSNVNPTAISQNPTSRCLPKRFK